MAASRTQAERLGTKQPLLPSRVPGQRIVSYSVTKQSCVQIRLQFRTADWRDKECQSVFQSSGYKQHSPDVFLLQDYKEKCHFWIDTFEQWCLWRKPLMASTGKKVLDNSQLTILSLWLLIIVGYPSLPSTTTHHYYWPTEPYNLAPVLISSSGQVLILAKVRSMPPRVGNDFTNFVAMWRLFEDYLLPTEMWWNVSIPHLHLSPFLVQFPLPHFLKSLCSKLCSENPCFVWCCLFAARRSGIPPKNVRCLELFYFGGWIKGIANRFCRHIGQIECVANCFVMTLFEAFFG